MTSFKQSSVANTAAESAPAVLVKLLSSDEWTENVAKLRPALFLAQWRYQSELYHYVLWMGHVISPELADDVSQLTLAGLLDGASEHFRPEQTEWLRADVEEFIHRLLSEDEKTLDAAATNVFFEQKQLGDPAERLSWYRELPEDIVERAEALLMR